MGDEQTELPALSGVKMKLPADLGADGRRLFAWLDEIADIAAAEPLVVELCRIADRLGEVRAKLSSQGVTVTGARGRPAKNPLCDVELKLSGQYAKLWRALGLADKTPDDSRRSVGRPPGGGGTGGWWQP